MIATSRYWVPLLAGSLAGCVSSSYYLPTDASLAVENPAGCTGALYGYANLQIAGGRSIRLTLTPAADKIEVAAQTKLRPGDSLRFVDTTISLQEIAPGDRTYVARFGRWESTVHGVRGVVLHRDTSDADGWIQGKEFSAHEEAARSAAFNLFTAKASVLAPKAERYSIVVPAVEVENMRIPSRTFEVHLHESTSVSRCLQ